MRRTVVIAVALGVLAAGCGGSSAPSGSPQPSGTPTPTATVPTPTQSPTQSPSPPPLLPYGHVADRSAIPWDAVGDGWFLVLVGQGPRITAQTATVPPDAPVTLYVVNPLGGRYRIAEWPHWFAKPPYAPVRIDAWSPDKRHAAYVSRTSEQPWNVVQMDLATGLSARFALPAGTLSAAVGYTRPSGASLLVMRRTGEHAFRLERWSAAGRRLAEIWRGDAGGWLSSPDGARYVVAGGSARPAVVSNAGGAPVTLRAAPAGCTPVRWWDAATVLMTCLADRDGYHRLWLVPTGGGPARPVTAIAAHPVVEFGYVDAVRAGGATYVQWTGDCGAADVRRLASAGGVATVRIPGAYDVNRLESAYQGRIAVWSAQGCEPNVNGGWLGWYDGGTGRVTPIIAQPAGRIGVIDVLPFAVSPRGQSTG